MDNRKMPTIEELQEMAAVDIRNVDKSTLVDLDDVEIHTELPLEERIADYIRQVKNPYCHISNGMIVKIIWNRLRKSKNVSVKIIFG